MSTITAPAPTYDDTDTHDRLAHIIHKKDHYKGYVLGEEVVALCGKKWVPSRDPHRFDICEACAAIYERMVNDT